MSAPTPMSGEPDALPQMDARGAGHTRTAAGRVRQQHLAELGERQLRLVHVHQVEHVVGHVSKGKGKSKSGSSGMMSAGTATLMKIKTSIGPVLANAKGFTLYWYARIPG